jgi:hypothetical protein
MFAKYVSADGRLVFLDDTKTIFNILSDSVRYATAFIPLSEVEFTNKKTGKRTIIISLWIPIT